MSNYNASPGVEGVDQEDGADTLTITAQNQLDFGDTFVGGTGKDTILFGPIGTPVTLDLSVVGNVAGFGFHSYEALAFRNTAGTSTAIFVANDFGGGFISNSLAVRGVNGSHQNITVNDAANFSAAHWSFKNWDSSDVVVIEGNGGGTSLTGSSHNDIIHAHQGADIITGGKGQDFLSGEENNDTFRFKHTTDSLKGSTHRDVIFDFDHDQGDRIDVHAIDANTLAGGNQNFHFIGAQHFHHKAGELHFVEHDFSGGGGTFLIVEGDVNGDGRADFQIEVQHNETNFLTSIAKGDFVL
jgi:Ca2+-binding RTX toxin-like protein